jgi:hypothetical protein
VVNFKLETFTNRLAKIGIIVKLTSNYPWIYLNEINGKTIVEKFQSNHGFTIAFFPIKEEQELQFTNINIIFKIIRKYKNEI